MTDRRLPEVSELRGILPDRLVVKIPKTPRDDARTRDAEDPIGLSDLMLDDLERRFGDTQTQLPAVISRHFLMSLIKANRELNRLWEQE